MMRRHTLDELPLQVNAPITVSRTSHPWPSRSNWCQPWWSR